VLKVSGIIPLSVQRVSTDDAWEARPPSWFLDSSVHKGDLLTGCIVGRFAEDIPVIDVDVEVIPSAAEVLTATLHAVTVEHAWIGSPLHRLVHESHLLIIGKISTDGSVDFLDVPTILPGGDAGPRRLTGDYMIQQGDIFLASGSVEEARRKELLSALTFEAEAAQSDIESSDVGVVELVLTPRSDLIGRTLADLHFREKYATQVVALWREGRPLLSLSSGLPLHYGDALLVQGPRKNFPLLAKDPDVLMLSEHRHTPAITQRSWCAVIALLMLVFVPPLTGLPVQEAAFLAACVVVFTGAIGMEQAYREIEWRVVFLLAFMIPLGLALQREVSTDAMAVFVQNAAASLSPITFLVLFMVISSAVSQLMDSSIAVLFLGPLAIAIGQHHGGSPYSLLLAVTFGSSLAFMFPTSSRANLLVSGVGGYRSTDFARIGIPFTLLVGLAILISLILVET
jgi:di/tricarboxylate transporter